MTTTEREQLLKELSNLPAWLRILDQEEESNDLCYVLKKDNVVNLIKNIQFEPTEGSTEDVKESEHYGCPNWELMYNTKVQEIEELQRQNELLHIQLERAWASLRTFEFVYGRKLDGIC